VGIVQENQAVLEADKKIYKEKKHYHSIKMGKINLKGLEILDEENKNSLNLAIEKHQEKLKWKTKSDFDLKIAIKIHEKNPDNKDKRKKYSISADLNGAVSKFHADSFGWDFNACVKEVFKKLEEEVEHKFHSSDQNK
jgi:hypothetical protein